MLFIERFARDLAERNAGQGAAAEAIARTTRFCWWWIFAADVGREQALRESDAGSFVDFAGTKRRSPKELGVAVLALSQLSRAPESRGGDHGRNSPICVNRVD